MDPVGPPPTNQLSTLPQNHQAHVYLSIRALAQPLYMLEPPTLRQRTLVYRDRLLLAEAAV